jgi:hypothetical protein
MGGYSPNPEMSSRYLYYILSATGLTNFNGTNLFNNHILLVHNFQLSPFLIRLYIFQIFLLCVLFPIIAIYLVKISQP